MCEKARNDEEGRNWNSKSLCGNDFIHPNTKPRGLYFNTQAFGGSLMSKKKPEGPERGSLGLIQN